LIPGFCSPNANCTNLQGLDICGNCNPGFMGNGTTCVDIDECLNTSACDPLTSCINTFGSYNCTPCPFGYSGNGKTGCVEINNCAGNPCSAPSQCINYVGYYNCTPCGAGYDGTGYTTCSPICNPNCTNGGVCTTPNVCDCAGTGYNGSICQYDINECLIAGSCDPLTNCTNTPGSYTCSPCPDGYDGTGKTGCTPTCVPGCSNGGTCIHPDQCMCPSGFGGSRCQSTNAASSLVVCFALYVVAFLLF